MEPPLPVLPPLLARRHRLLPLPCTPGALRLGAAPIPAAEERRAISFALGAPVAFVEVDAGRIEAYLAALPPAAPETSADEGAPRDDGAPAGDGAAHPAGDGAAGCAARVRHGTAVQLVEAVLDGAVREGASDVHVEPFEHAVRVRYRLDGVLQTRALLPGGQRASVVARLKVLAGLDVAERRRPQDGRLRLPHDGRMVDLRVSTLPTTYGEKIVLRVLDRRRAALGLDALGLTPPARAHLDDALRLTHGLLLVTGPTGSGKTTTLYAALRALDLEHLNVLTIEDPVEYDLPGISQSGVRADLGFDFATALRAFLRQDPDVILVGEMRDRETASMAVRAALTGHLVLSTLHTNDAAGAIARLVDLGVPPYLVAGTLRLVLAQRLARQLCASCRRAWPDDPAVRGALGLPQGRYAAPGGCEACGGTGFRGRLALFETLPFDDALAAASTSGGAAAVRREARARGLPDLHTSAHHALATHRTSPDEALRVTAC